MPRPIGCPSFRQMNLAVSRRGFLQAGGLAALGLGLPGLIQAEATGRSRPARAKSCLLVYCFGGFSHLDMCDLKPNAPREIRGEFGPIATAVPGLDFCEHLPRLARVADRLTLVRSMTHDRSVHGGAVGFVLTGTRTLDPGIPGVRGPDATLGDHPNLGSTVARFRPADGPVPSAVALPYTMIDGQGRFVPGQTAGLLGGTYDPWFVADDPSKPGFRVEGLTLPHNLTDSRMGGRKRLLDVVDDQIVGLDTVASVAKRNDYVDRAFSILTSPRTRRAFEIGTEPAGLRDSYGRNTFGQSCLLGRRLIEAGVRFVQVNMGNSLGGPYGWDTHDKNFPRLKNELLPKFDPAVAALIDDMDARGLLDETLVVVMGEFGRKPKIQTNGGRDHWPRCYSLFLAGAGIRRGVVVGASDKDGAEPVADPITPEQIAATIFDALGINPSTELRDHQDRPVPLVRAEPLPSLFG